MEDNNRILTAYSFLAALTENNRDIYGTVFVPLCKRALSLFAKTANTGCAEDIKRVLKTEYGLEVPVSIVRELINKVAAKQSRKEKVDFNLRVMEKGNLFSFDDYDCGRIERLYDEERRRARALEESFNAFAELEGYVKIPSFQDFIDNNKHRLSTFFSGDYESLKDQPLGEGFLPHAKFLRKIEGENQQLFKAAENAYLGSLMAAYLEAGVDLDSRLEKGVVYYIDTRVILEAMDLQGPETTRPALDMLDLIKTTGGSARVLSITIEEITRILEKEVKNYNKHHPITTIGDALVRLNRNKAWLVSLKGNVESVIFSTLGISSDKISEHNIQEYSRDSEVQELINSGYRKDNAIHDISACLTVRERRSLTSKERPQKAKYWFVSANSKLSLFNKKHCAGVPEIVMPGELTSLLFLKDPRRYGGIVSKQGLSALIARTLTEEYADKDLINEFDSVIRNSSLDISEQDYELLLEHVALESTSRLQQLVDEVQDSVLFENDVHKIIEKARGQKAEQAQVQKDVLDYKEKVEKERIQQEKNRQELENRLSNLEVQVKEAKGKSASLVEEIANEQKKLKRWKHVGISLLIALFFVALSFFLPVKDLLRKIFEWIAGLGGFWGFLNLILNAIKAK